MKYSLCGAFTAILLLLASQEAAALNKKQQAAWDKCVHAENVCITTKCGHLGYGKETRDCLAKCQNKGDRCRRKAEQLGPVQSSPGESNSDVPVLSTE